MKHLLLALFLGLATPALACTYPEKQLTDAIVESPDRLITILEDQRVDEFLNNLMRAGYMTGSLPYVMKIYVISAKMKPGYDTPHVWLFFIQDGCILTKIPVIRSVVEENLPPEGAAQ